MCASYQNVMVSACSERLYHMLDRRTKLGCAHASNTPSKIRTVKIPAKFFTLECKARIDPQIMMLHPRYLAIGTR